MANKQSISYHLKRAREIESIIDKIETLKLTIKELKRNDHYELRHFRYEDEVKHLPQLGKYKRYSNVSIQITHPFSTQEQKIVDDFRNNLIRCYTNQISRLRYRLKKL